MAERKECKKYIDCGFRKELAGCPLSCIHYKHKDEVRVVRCKDCKHWGIQENCDPSFKYYCNAYALYAWGRPVRNADDFCSYGERKDNAR